MADLDIFSGNLLKYIQTNHSAACSQIEGVTSYSDTQDHCRDLTTGRPPTLFKAMLLSPK